MGKMDRKAELACFERQNIREVQERIKEEYQHEYSTLEACLEEEFLDPFRELEDLIKAGDEAGLVKFAEEAEKTSKSYASNWYDEDLECVRGGYEWESNFFWTLACIARGEHRSNPNKVWVGGV